MERVGVSRRLPAAILDGLFILILIAIGVTIYVAVGGARLGVQAQQALGVPVTWNRLASQDTWQKYERRLEEVIGEIERMIREDFTTEQAEFIGRTLDDSMEKYVVPDSLSVQFFLDLDEEHLNALVDEAFDSVIAADRADISADKVNALRGEVKAAMDEFGVFTILPKVIDFAIWLAFLPAIIILIYGLGEAVFGRSLGKLALGIAIRREDGERAYAGNYMLRYVIKNSPMLLLILALLLRSPGVGVAAGVAVGVVFIGVLVMLGPDRRALYDYIAGTAVVRVGSGD